MVSLCIRVLHGQIRKNVIKKKVVEITEIVPGIILKKRWRESEMDDSFFIGEDF